MTMLPSAFARLRGLLHDVDPPPGREPVSLHLGEFRRDTPAGYFDALADVDAWCRYPPLGGTAELRSAYLQWLNRRFGLTSQRRRDFAPPEAHRPGTIAAEPTPGSKQAVAVAVALAAARARDRDGAQASRPPRVVLPNPFYPTYLAATEAVGARPVFYTVGTRDRGDGGDNGDNGDNDGGGGGGGGSGAVAVIAAAVRRAGGRAAAIVVCNPGNPRGEILSAATLRAVWTIAAAAGAMLIIDECYTDLSTGTAPPGFLTVVETVVESTDREPAPFLVLHSLSKRSGVPGLRGGFVAGDPSSVAGYAQYNRSCGVSNPLPVCAAAASLWSDDSHVARRRASLARIWDLADHVLGDLPGYRRAQAGFFLWMPVKDDEETARRLWRDDALTVMPGRYLAVDDAGVNPGIDHLRIALVHEEKVMEEALARIRSTLTG
jgi:aspartate/methionine/tyrosine aminotransferase